MIYVSRVNTLAIMNIKPIKQNIKTILNTVKIVNKDVKHVPFSLQSKILLANRANQIIIPSNPISILYIKPV